jgi:hypothetical protein
MNKINWNWPRTKNNHFFPWYIILKNIVILPLIFLGGSIMLAGQLIKFLGGLICYLYLCLAYNPKHANIWWNREMGV